MCGIVGALSFGKNSFFVSDEYLTTMRDTLLHRGPDGGANWISSDKKIGLGHRRLSIIDLSHEADQPMCNEDGSLWIVYNGEIYNHVEIRKELQRKGNHKWKTHHSDTEVILHSFEEWGIDCIHKFRGMFAIALWDNKKRELWLIRDRIGIKPLYYSVHHGRIVFASEIKAILKDADQAREVNEEALYDYLSFLTTPSPHTFFAGIKKLPSASWMKISADGTVFENRYWDVWDNTSPLIKNTEEEIARMIISELRTSVNLRKVSDVPVGVFLSGGIDSSTNAALFSEGEVQPVKTFTIGYKGDYKSSQNEMHYARKMADSVNAEYHEKILTIDDLIDFLPRMIYLQDEPIADPVSIPLYYVSKLARENGVIVCQVGEGSDELFFGYPHWKTALRLQQCNDIPFTFPIKKLLLTAMKSGSLSGKFSYEWLRRGISNQPVFWGGAEAFTEVQKKTIISPRLKSKFARHTSWDTLKPIHSRFMEKAWDSSTLNWMTYLDLNLRLPELLLLRVDKMSMAVSLEGRVPFLDHKFVELVMSIPTDMKFKNGTLKYILKKSVRGIIPDQLIDRKKQGFGVPIHEWFMEKLGEFTNKELTDFCHKTDFFNHGEVMRLIDQRKSLHIWVLLNFAMWWKEYIYK